MKSSLLVPALCVCVITPLASASATEARRTPVVTRDRAAQERAPSRASGSEPIRRPRSAENAIYLDLLGPGLLYSINYDRRLGDELSARVGFSYLSLGTGDSNDGSGLGASFSYWAVPLTLSYLGIGSASNMLELGAGPVIVHVRGSGFFDAGDDDAEAGLGTTLLAATALFGYRHQPRDGGLVFRVGASPLLSFGAGALPWGYLSLGAAF